MLHFSKNMIYNLSYEVVELKWNKLENNLKNNVKVFDDIINFHEDFIQGCAKESLILDKEFSQL